MIGLTTCVRAGGERGVCRAPTAGHPAPSLTSREFWGGWGFSSRTVLRGCCAWVCCLKSSYVAGFGGCALLSH